MLRPRLLPHFTPRGDCDGSAALAALGSIPSPSLTQMDDSLCQVLAILILDTQGERLAVKYPRAGKELWPDIKRQTAFEKLVAGKLPKFGEASKSEPDVTMVEEYLVLYQAANDVVVCVVTPSTENELMVVQVVECIWAALLRASPGILSNGPSRQLVVDSLSDVYFFLDEVIDDGLIMETDEAKVQARIYMRDDLEGDTGGGEALGSPPEAGQSKGSKFLSSFIGRAVGR
uniref:Coatomer subunit zeta n=1 Tax=Alexandrium andersonii TaxID=327968 RepID=A0A7S2IND8_9DINO